MTSGGASGVPARRPGGAGAAPQGSDGRGSCAVPSEFCGIYGPAHLRARAHVARVPHRQRFAYRAHDAHGGRRRADAGGDGGPMTDRQSLDAAPRRLRGRLREGIQGLRVGWSLDLGVQVDPRWARWRSAPRSRSRSGDARSRRRGSLRDTREMIHVMWNAHYAGTTAQFLDESAPAWIRPGRGPRGWPPLPARKPTWRCVAASTPLRRGARALRHLTICADPTVSSRPSRSGGLNPVAPAACLGLVPWAGSATRALHRAAAATVPAGFTASGMPVGLQIVGRRSGRPTVLQASAAFEQAAAWAQKRPAV